MKPFNLAEAQIAERTYCQTHLDLRVKVIIMLVAAVLIVAVISYGASMMVLGRAAHAKSELADAEQRNGSIEQRIKHIDAKLSQRKWQDQLAKGSERWIGLVNTAIDSMPADIWLTRLETSPKDSTMTLEGRAASFDVLSQFIDNLRHYPAFSDIRLGSAKVVRTGNFICVEFAMPVKIKTSIAAPAASGSSSASISPASGKTLVARYPL